MLPMLLLDVSLTLDAEDGPPTYRPGGRRDPFLRPGAFAQFVTACPGEGLEGLRIQELALRGVVRTSEGALAMFAAPDGRSHFARAGARLCDGTLLSVHLGGVTFEQEIDPGLGPVQKREVVRPLHP